MNEDLIAAIRADPKSGSAWEAWFRMVYPRVLYITAAKGSGNIELAEEMTQAAIERFLRYRAYEKIDSDLAAVSYLARIAERLMMDEYRREQRTPSWSPEKFDELAAPGSPNLRSDELEVLLGQLSEADQVVLRLFLSGRKTKEIASLLRLEYSTAGMRIKRAKAHLKKIAAAM